MSEQSVASRRFATDEVRHYAHDPLCKTFHPRDLPVEMCRWCDALDQARAQERAAIVRRLSDIHSGSHPEDSFDAGFRHALDRTEAIIKSL
jgi:hypothetical protein